MEYDDFLVAGREDAGIFDVSETELLGFGIQVLDIDVPVPQHEFAFEPLEQRKLYVRGDVPGMNDEIDLFFDENADRFFCPLDIVVSVGENADFHTLAELCPRRN